ncbi:hypothetical protein [Streptomyces sp. NBC_00989]|uniref:hypothetical protein n=1 Tax=Streptomyces sp. NBC_00989 TaxID=2903705 RepID=UPI002F90BEAD|nr:hypothetical protein OG714_54310 [Streptomyces sp. NBC_00989]
MTSTEFPAIDRDKSPLIDADYDPERIAAALRNSPHLLAADGEAGGDTVRFTTPDGAVFTLTLRDAPPTDDDILPDPLLNEAVAAAILNDRNFCVASPDYQGEDTITVQTRSGGRYLLVLGFESAESDQKPSTPAADIAQAADRVLISNPSDADRSAAELLNYIAATWNKQDLPLRQHAQAVARNLLRALDQ